MFVDDIKVIKVKKLSYIEKVKYKQVIAFEIVNIGPISFYLDLKVKKDCQNKTLKLSQSIYIDKIIAKYYFHQVKSYNTLIKKVILLLNKGLKASQTDWEQYQGMTGSLIFLIMETRPDIVIAILVNNCFIENPS